MPKNDTLSINPEPGTARDKISLARMTKQEKAIQALMTQPTIEKAAQEAQIHPATLYRWMKQAQFQEKWVEARRTVSSVATARLQQAGPAAVSLLFHLMKNENTPT